MPDFRRGRRHGGAGQACLKADEAWGKISPEKKHDILIAQGLGLRTDPDLRRLRRSWKAASAGSVEQHHAGAAAAAWKRPFRMPLWRSNPRPQSITIRAVRCGVKPTSTHGSVRCGRPSRQTSLMVPFFRKPDR